MTYVIHRETCEYRVEQLTRASAVEAAFQHCEETQHGGVAIEDRLDLDHRNGADEDEQ